MHQENCYIYRMTKAKKFKTDAAKLNDAILKSGRKKLWLAEQIGVHHSTISGWTSGRREPSYTAMKLLALILEVEIEELEQAA
jgi:DNA-binding transcriptional regulator YiaG